MKVLITGAGGSIGMHVIAHLMENTDWDIVVIDSFRHKGFFDRITLVTDGKSEWQERLRIITHDLTAPFSTRQIAGIGEVDHIINLASLADVGDSIENPVPFIKNNVDIVLNMLEYARIIKPKSFVQFSTDEVYGPADKDQAHKEWETILPSNPYAASKAAQEAICIAYWRSYGVPIIITNTMNNFAPAQGVSKYPVIIQKKLMTSETIDVHISSDGQIGTRYYIHSRNAADALLFILQTTTPYMHKPGFIDRPDRYNIVGEQYSNLEIAQLIATLMGKELEYSLIDFHSKQPGHDVHYGLDGEKLAKMGWKQPIDFEKSLKDTIDWQLEHKEWIT